MRRRGLTRGDGILSTGLKQPDSISRGDVFEVDEYTDLIDSSTLSKNGGLSNKNHPPSKETKPDATSKSLDENITTEKKIPDKGFPKTSVDNTIIDLDLLSISKKTPAGENSSPEDPDSNLLKGGDDRVTSSPVPPSSFTDTTNDNHKIVPNVVFISRTRGLVQGSDGKMYHIHPGPPGPTGPTGKPVSTTYYFSFYCRVQGLESMPHFSFNHNQQD